MNEFRPRHALLLAHVWLIHKRLLADGESGKLMQESIFDLLWDDTSMRIRSMGINELSVNKNLVSRGQQFRNTRRSYLSAMLTLRQADLATIPPSTPRHATPRRVLTPHAQNLLLYLVE